MALVGAEGADSQTEVLSEDGERTLVRTWHVRRDGSRTSVLAVRVPTGQATNVRRLVHEYELKDTLAGAWAAKPLELLRDCEQTVLLLEDPGCEPLERRLGNPIKVGDFLRLAIGIAAALAQVHKKKLIHRDLKPANILVNFETGHVCLTGFGIASSLLRERQPPVTPETIVGTLAYMAPEQTGRMNRSIDFRSDLYAAGIIFYQMLTGALPFVATDAMEWVHYHIARQPRPPSELIRSVPAILSTVIMKLLAKSAEERYQTAAGLEHDLRRCRALLEAEGRIVDFRLGSHDTSDRLLVPEKLYGRSREVKTLLEAFGRVVNRGAPELVLVSGYSGIGKSSVVSELQPVLVPPRGLYASGKFDQYKREIPYSTLVQAFQGLVRPLLGKSEADIAPWRDALREALGPNAGMIADLVPEVKLIIGSPPPIPELPPQDLQRRFQMVFRRFLTVFARPEHPLALFLDDLQWLDAATLDVLEDLLTHKDTSYLLLIGAYRDNEVTTSHPLMRTIARIRGTGVPVHDIVLTPLALAATTQLLEDSLYCDHGRAAPLAELVYQKTGGNPFFVIQFLRTLVEEELLVFDHATASWVWALDRIHAKKYTDNVVDLMVGKISRLPAHTQTAMQQLASLGDKAAFALLAAVSDKSEQELRDELREALEAELVFVSRDTCQFLHDRVQEAAYSLIPPSERATVHLGIGRRMAAHIPREEQGEAIFEIVNQLNRGADLMTSQDEKDGLAEFNLIAAKRAKGSTAYVSAIRYLDMGAALLAENGWDRRPDIMFPMKICQAECEFLTGKLEIAETHLTTLSSRAADPVSRAAVACLQMDLYTSTGNSGRAVDVCIAYLLREGVEFSLHPTQEDVRREHAKMCSLLGSREIGQLVDLPLMDNPILVAIMDVLIKALSPASIVGCNVFNMIVLRMVNLSIEHGNTDASCEAYTQISKFGGASFENYEQAFQFCRLGNDLIDRRGLNKFRSRARLCYAIYYVQSMEHPSVARGMFHRAFDAAVRVGEFPYATYALHHITNNLFASGNPLAEVQASAERSLEFCRDAHYGLMADVAIAQIEVARTLRGLNPSFGSLNSSQFDEEKLEQRLATDPFFELAAYWYWTRKLQARLFAGDYAAAVGASLNAQQLIWQATSNLDAAESLFYGALAHAAACDTAPPAEREEHVRTLRSQYRQLAKFSESCSDIFKNRADLVGAEIARIEGRDTEAGHLYETAIKLARANEFTNNEALANELAARFHAARGLETAARAHNREARSCYKRWGAEGKIRQLEVHHPYLRELESKSALATTIETQIEHLDLATVVNISQALSGEMVQEKLIARLMRTAIEQAGAERGLLILWRAGRPRIAAEATTSSDATDVNLCDEKVSELLVPLSVLNYTQRTCETLVVADARTHTMFADDPYVRRRGARSILCLPLLNRNTLVGMLFLENHLADDIFAPARITILKLVSSLAAVALENSRLYSDLQAREAKIRRLVDASIIGIYTIDFEGHIFEANDAFLNILGYHRDDVASGRLRWTDLTPPEWRVADLERVKIAKMTGRLDPFEKEYFHKNGTRVPVMVSVARLEEGGNQAVAFMVDLSGRKQAEAEAKNSEERFRSAQRELEHANRVATMGQLSASMGHEISQPLSGVITNAQTASRCLKAPSPDIEQAVTALARVVRDGKRIDDVVRRIRMLIRKAPPQNNELDINIAILEVVGLTHGEAVNNGVSVQTNLGDDLPLIYGDKVQLQQVILNLTMNAIEAMKCESKGPKEILFATSMVGNNVVVEVRDTGPGIEVQMTERIFNAFYSTKSDGLGLGLSICRSIVEGHGGRLWATANAPRGAVLRFTLPTTRANLQDPLWPSGA